MLCCVVFSYVFLCCLMLCFVVYNVVLWCIVLCYVVWLRGCELVSTYKHFNIVFMHVAQRTFVFISSSLCLLSCLRFIPACLYDIMFFNVVELMHCNVVVLPMPGIDLPAGLAFLLIVLCMPVSSLSVVLHWMILFYAWCCLRLPLQGLAPPGEDEEL